MKNNRTLTFAGALVSCLTVAMLAGCTHLGPQTIALDRFDYSASIADSWKQQTLLNIVKLRYMDLPVFVDVASIVAGYSMQTGVDVSGTSSSDRAIQRDFVNAGASAIYTDRPTITYVPTTGERFLRALITPIDPKNIFFMLQSGYAADFVLGLTVESINGVQNRSTAGGIAREADPSFIRALLLLRELQSAGGFALRVEENKAKGSTGVLFFRREDIPPEMLEKAREVRRLLKMPAEGQRFTLTYSPGRGAADELAINSRSMLQIMAAFASYVDIPEPHMSEHSATPAPDAASAEASGQKIHVFSGKNKPAAAYAAVRYRGYWFWIDDRDWRTKRALTAVMFFFTLTDSGSQEKLPLITIPAQ